MASNLQRVGRFVLRNRWLVVGATLAASELLGLVVPQVALFGVGLAVASLLLVLVDISRAWSAAAARRFMPSQFDYSDVKRSLRGNERFQLWALRNGTFLADLVASARFAEGATMATIAPKRYVLPTEFREPGRAYSNRELSLSSYNAAVLGLTTNLGLSGDQWVDEVQVVRSQYSDHIASNIFAATTPIDPARGVQHQGRNLFIDRQFLPRDFGDSWLLNAVGVSALAITADGRFLVVEQSKHNLASRGLFAPTGSGSLEPQDFRGSERLPFAHLVANGALREMAEEAGIRHVKSWTFLGFGRWFDRGAKPEAFILAELEVDAREVSALRTPRPDRRYSKGVTAHRFEVKLNAWRQDRPYAMVPPNVRHSMSLPLAVSMAFLARKVQQDDGLRASLAEVVK